MDCPRSYFFEFILGWRPFLPNVHLAFGIGLHASLEYLMLHGYSQDNAMTAHELFDKVFQEEYVSICGDDHPKKNSGNAFYSLQMYQNAYQSDLTDFEVLHTEIAGSVMIDLDKKFYYRSDAICKGDICGLTGYFSMEHKTGTTFSELWADKWKQKTQLGVYSHVLHTIYPHDEVIGVIINGFFPAGPPALTKQGVPYANYSPPDFQRVLVRKTPLQMEDWIITTINWYDDIVKDTEAVLKVQDDEPVMSCFRKNPEACDKYFGCKYRNFCHLWANPVHKGAVVQEGFREFHWNPIEMMETAKEVIEV